ncbi:MAG: hypothetical protein ACI8YQ_002809 [Polaribacter sp.]|jgi:hypothetical protein
MNIEILYQNLDRNIPFIQSSASKLTKDFEIARFLYQETTHQAIKNKDKLREETFKEWLIETMKIINAKIDLRINKRIRSQML